MSQPIITVANLGKKYRIRHQAGAQGYSTFREALSNAVKNWFNRASGHGRAGALEDFWALKTVSFEVKPGEVVGIVGRNGAGKSTLLKILSRITEPTEGRILLRGRVASLLEVGTGFHPELTGRENIFLNGAILGMSRLEIRRKFDEIVAFAEVDTFLDTPVKRYSSGMYVRLAFAVAAHLEPEILIVDEVLAVGDTQFQAKCLGKMREVSTGGRTVLFVSHNMSAVENLCRRAILMQKGTLVFDGDPREAIARYRATFEQTDESDSLPQADRSGNGRVRLQKVTLLSEGVRTRETASGADVQFEFAYTNPASQKAAQLAFTLYTEHGVAVANIHSSMLGHRIELQPDSGIVTCCLPRLTLNHGRYRLAAAIQDESGENYDHVPSALWFTVTHSRFYPTGKSPDPRFSLVLADHSWLTAGVPPKQP